MSIGIADVTLAKEFRLLDMPDLMHCGRILEAFVVDGESRKASLVCVVSMIGNSGSLVTFTAENLMSCSFCVGNVRTPSEKPILESCECGLKMVVSIKVSAGTCLRFEVDDSRRHVNLVGILNLEDDCLVHYVARDGRYAMALQSRLDAREREILEHRLQGVVGSERALETGNHFDRLHERHVWKQPPLPSTQQGMLCLNLDLMHRGAQRSKIQLGRFFINGQRASCYTVCDISGAVLGFLIIEAALESIVVETASDRNHVDEVTSYHVGDDVFTGIAAVRSQFIGVSCAEAGLRAQMKGPIAGGAIVDVREAPMPRICGESIQDVSFMALDGCKPMYHISGPDNAVKHFLKEMHRKGAYSSMQILNENELVLGPSESEDLYPILHGAQRNGLSIVEKKPDEGERFVELEGQGGFIVQQVSQPTTPGDWATELRLPCSSVADRELSLNVNDQVMSGDVLERLQTTCHDLTDYVLRHMSNVVSCTSKGLTAVFLPNGDVYLTTSVNAMNEEPWFRCEGRVRAVPQRLAASTRYGYRSMAVAGIVQQGDSAIQCYVIRIDKTAVDEEQVCDHEISAGCDTVDVLVERLDDRPHVTVYEAQAMYDKPSDLKELRVNYFEYEHGRLIGRGTARCPLARPAYQLKSRPSLNNPLLSGVYYVTDQELLMFSKRTGFKAVTKLRIDRGLALLTEDTDDVCYWLGDTVLLDNGQRLRMSFGETVLAVYRPSAVETVVVSRTWLSLKVRVWSRPVRSPRPSNRMKLQEPLAAVCGINLLGKHANVTYLAGVDRETQRGEIQCLVHDNQCPVCYQPIKLPLAANEAPICIRHDKNTVVLVTTVTQGTDVMAKLYIFEEKLFTRLEYTSICECNANLIKFRSHEREASSELCVGEILGNFGNSILCREASNNLLHWIPLTDVFDMDETQEAVVLPQVKPLASQILSGKINVKLKLTPHDVALLSSGLYDAEGFKSQILALDREAITLIGVEGRERPRQPTPTEPVVPMASNSTALMYTTENSAPPSSSQLDMSSPRRDDPPSVTMLDDRRYSLEAEKPAPSPHVFPAIVELMGPTMQQLTLTAVHKVRVDHLYHRIIRLFPDVYLVTSEDYLVQDFATVTASQVRIVSYFGPQIIKGALWSADGQQCLVMLGEPGVFGWLVRESLTIAQQFYCGSIAMIPMLGEPDDLRRSYEYLGESLVVTKVGESVYSLSHVSFGEWGLIGCVETEEGPYAVWIDRATASKVQRTVQGPAATAVGEIEGAVRRLEKAQRQWEGRCLAETYCGKGEGPVLEAPGHAEFLARCAAAPGQAFVPFRSAGLQEASCGLSSVLAGRTLSKEHDSLGFEITRMADMSGADVLVNSERVGAMAQRLAARRFVDLTFMKHAADQADWLRLATHLSHLG